MALITATQKFGTDYRETANHIKKVNTLLNSL